jgi:D-alanyl-D-alanine carboxypeptidase
MPQHAPSTGDPAIVAVLERARTALSLPGVGARWIGIGAQVRSGEAVVGYRSLATLEPLALDDAFHLGSDTKAMTATLFMVGAERGALSWSATLGEVVPVAAIHPAYGNVSLAEVASHRAGLPRDATTEDLEAVEDLPPIAARRALVARVLARAPDGTRGTFAYSNVGYVLLGSIIESAEGRTYEEAMRARVFEPLGMSSCGFDAPGLGELPPYPGVPVGHDANNTPMPPGEKDRTIVVAAGSRTYCSLTDWSRFVADQLQARVAAAVSCPRTDTGPSTRRRMTGNTRSVGESLGVAAAACCRMRAQTDCGMRSCCSDWTRGARCSSPPIVTRAMRSPGPRSSSTRS